MEKARVRIKISDSGIKILDSHNCDALHDTNKALGVGGKGRREQKISVETATMNQRQTTR